MVDNSIYKNEKAKELYNKTIQKLKNDLDFFSDELQEAIDENNESEIAYNTAKIERIKFELSILTA